MATSTVKYLGGLRTEAVHLESGNTIITDAPKDNHGNAQAFSPTDIMSTSLASCMMTMMGIVARRDNLKIEGTTAEVTKVMYSDPRRVGEIHVKMVIPPANLTDKDKKVLEHTAYTCPVAKSLHPDIKQVIEIIFM